MTTAYRIDHPEPGLVPPQGRGFAFGQDGATISVHDVPLIEAIDHETGRADRGS